MEVTKKYGNRRIAKMIGLGSDEENSRENMGVCYFDETTHVLTKRGFHLNIHPRQKLQAAKWGHKSKYWDQGNFYCAIKFRHLICLDTNQEFAVDPTEKGHPGLEGSDWEQDCIMTRGLVAYWAGQLGKKYKHKQLP